MATTNSRDVELRIAAKATGNDQIVNLTNELLDMAKTAGSAAPEFEQLAAQLTKLGQQNAATKVFEEISLDVDKSAAAMFEATQRVQKLGAEFTEQSAIVERYKAAQAQARDAVRQTSDALAAAKTDLTRFKEDASAADRATVGYKDKLVELRTAVRALEDQLTQQKGLVDSKTKYNEITGSLDKLANAYLNAQTKVGTLDRSLTEQNAKLDAAKQALSALGVEAIDVKQAQEALAKSAVDVTSAIRTQTSYSQQLEAEMQRLAAAEREVASLNAFEQKRQEAIRLQQAAEYVNFWTDALNKAEAAERQLAAESQRAAQALSNAFSTTGVRSAREIESEIQQINQALRVMASSGQVTGKEFDRAFLSAKDRVANLQRELAGLPPKITESNAALGALRQSFSQLTAAFGAFEIGRAFIEANNQFETLRRTMTLVTGSTQGAADQIKFLRDTANRTGLSVGALSQDFVNFSASMQTSGIALDKQREVFGAVANAAGQLGLSTDRVGLILQALSQTANKGKVSLEELQGQLGESLPGALAIVANGLGVTKERLLDMVKAGIDTNTFFDAFIRGTRSAFGEGESRVTSFAAAFNRLKNAFSEFASRASDSTPFKLLVSAIDGAATNFDRLATAVKVAAEAFLLFKFANWLRDSAALSGALQKNTIDQEANTASTHRNAAAKVEQSVATDKSTGALNANTAAAKANALQWPVITAEVTKAGVAKEQAAKSAGVLATAGGLVTSAFGAMRGAASSLLGLIGGLPGVLALVALNARELGTWIGETAARFAGWGKVLDESEKKLEAQAAAEKKAADEARALADAQRIAEQQALGLSGQSAKLYDEFIKVEKESGSASEALKKLAKDLDFGDLKGIENAGKALNALAATGKLSAQQIKEAFAGALKNEDLLKFETNARAAFAGVKGGAEQLKIVLDALADESLRRVGTSALEVKTGFSSAMNSAINDTDRLKETLKGLNASAEQTSVLLAKAVSKEVEAATTRKAIDEVIGRIQQLGSSGELAGKQLEDALTGAYNKAIELANTDKDLKRLEDEIKAIAARSPEMGVAFAGSLEKIKGKLLELNPLMKQLAADAELLGIKLAAASNKAVPSTEELIRAYERLKASGKATAGEVQDAFTAMAEKVIKANGGVVPEWLKVEAAIRGVTLATKEAGNAAVDFANKSVSGLGAIVSATETAIEKTKELADWQKKGLSGDPTKGATYNKDGWAVNKSGDTFSAEIPTGLSIYNDAKNMGASEELAKKLAKRALDPNGNLIFWDNPLQKDYGVDTISMAIMKAVQQEKLSTGIAINGGPATSGGSVGGLVGASATSYGSSGASSAQITNPATTPASYKVDIVINGTSSTVNTASQADAATLAELLKQIGEAANRTGP